MQTLTDRERDIIAVKSKLLEQAMWDAAKENTYVYKPKFSLGQLMDDHLRLMVISLAPMILIVMSIVVDLMN